MSTFFVIRVVIIINFTKLNKIRSPNRIVAQYKLVTYYIKNRTLQLNIKELISSSGVPHGVTKRPSIENNDTFFPKKSVLGTYIKIDF